MGKISNYTRALVAKLQDVFVIDSTDNNVTTTKSVTVEQIGNAICKEQVHSDLKTDDQTIIGGINELAKAKNIADEYDDTHTYNAGDVTIYGNTLYICNTNNTTGDFDPSKWTATTIDNVIGSLSTLTTTDKSSIVGAVNEVNNSLTNYNTSTVTDIFATYQGTMISDVIVTQTHKVTSMVLRGTIPAGNWQTVGTVKDRFKNSVYNQFFAVIDTTATYIGMMYLGTDGTVNFFLQGTGNKNFDFGFTYIAQ